MTANDRDRLIKALRARGMSSRAIAPVVGLTDRRVRQICSRWEIASHLTDAEPSR